MKSERRKPPASTIATRLAEPMVPSIGECRRPQLDPITVRIRTAVQITGISRSKLYELIKAGDLETVKIGSSTLLKMDSLRRLTRTMDR